MIHPDLSGFLALAREGDLVAVVREIPFDTETAVTAYAKLARPPFSFLLESVTGGESWSRWTFLGTAPHSAWRLDADGQVALWAPERGWGDAVSVDDPLDDLAGRLRGLTPVLPPGATRGLPRFFGGAVGYLGYDVVRSLERLQAPPVDDLGFPQALLVFTDLVVAIDNVFQRAHIIATVDVRGSSGENDLRRRYHAARARIADITGTLRDAPGPEPLRDASGPGPQEDRYDRLHDATAPSSPAPPRSLFGRAAFEAGVRRIKDYITAGDAFQVVLSQRLDVERDVPPFDLYRRLRSLNPSPYMYLLEFDGLAVVGASPEVLVRVEGGRVTVRPIAGTRPRGASATEDAALERELLADEKERAEHLMLVDLGRNDVGRVARYGSVRVPELMGIERYSHVLHMVSQVEGDLRDGADAFDAFRATFPAGTVSGAPKVRAMEIIDELEPTRRGPYAGAVGYFDYGGRAMDTAIAIRTLVAARGRLHIQAGAGIVADSDPAREYEETLAKAAALLSVLESLDA